MVRNDRRVHVPKKEKSMNKYLRGLHGLVRSIAIALALVVVAGPSMVHADASTQAYMDTLTTGVITDVNYGKSKSVLIYGAVLGVIMLGVLTGIVVSAIRGRKKGP